MKLIHTHVHNSYAWTQLFFIFGVLIIPLLVVLYQDNLESHGSTGTNKQKNLSQYIHQCGPKTTSCEMIVSLTVFYLGGNNPSLLNFKPETKSLVSKSSSSSGWSHSQTLALCLSACLHFSSVYFQLWSTSFCHLNCDSTRSFYHSAPSLQVFPPVTE